jgi:hypothetical protein
MFWSTRLLPWVPLIWLVACSTTATVMRQPERRPEEQTPVHLVVDLGSSGTRFCLYRVRSGPGQRGCELSAPRPVCSRVRGGLARLTRTHRPGHVAELIEPQLRSAWTLLGDPSGGDPALRSRVRAATALGTGGFRDRATGQPVERPEWQTLFTEVEQFLKREAGATTAIARPITGEEEGRLAWLGLAQGEGRPEEFAAVEAGGATIQLAVGKAGAGPVEVATDPQGQDVVFERFLLGSRATARAFQVCYNPKRPRKQDALQCIDLLAREVFRNSAVHRLAEKSSARPLFGLGLSFADLFRSYPAAPPWPKKEDAVMHEKLTLERIRQLAVLLCPRTDHEIKAYAPNALALKGDPSGGGGRACYYLAYRVALLDAVRHVAAGAELYSAEEDQWTRGAAVSGDFFPDCKQ